MYGVLLITVLIITGGAIAFIGDRLGTKVGKKRLSIFGLRPRHTSILVTIITGALITTMTFAVMAAASENVRTALFGMEQLKANMQEMRDKIEQADVSLAASQREKELADEALGEAKKRVESMQEKQRVLEAESKRLEAGNAELTAANAALQGMNGALADKNNALSAENSGLQAANSELTGTNAKLTADNKTLETRTKELRDGLITMREGDITFRAGEILASGVIKGARSEAEVERDLQSLAQVANRNASTRLGENRTEDDVWIYAPEAQAAIKAIAESDQDMVVRIVAAGNLVRGEPVRSSLELYKNSIIYKDGEFILARPYELKSHGEGECEQVVMDFLRGVNQAATQKGILQDPISGAVGVMDGAQFYGLVESLSRVKDNFVLSAYARDATDAQGPLRLDIRIETEPSSQYVGE